MEKEMNVIKFNHNNGEELIPHNIKNNLICEISQLTISPFKCAELKKCLKKILKRNGWSNPVRVLKYANITITSLKGKTGLCIQFGNVARFYADILKLQQMFNDEHISNAIYIILTKITAKKCGSNIANYERFTKELKYFKDIINLPVLVLGIGECE
jgi:hypothetical protein